MNIFSRAVRKVGSGVENLGNAAGDLVNNPLKAVKDGANDKATLATLASLAGGYGAYQAGLLGGAGTAVAGTAEAAGAAGADVATTAGVMGSAGAGAGTDAVLGGTAAGSGGLSALLPKVGEYLISPGGLKTVGNVAGSLIGAVATNNAANTQADAAKAAAATVAGQQAPYVAAGKAAIDRLSAGAAPGGQFSKPFTMADATNSPAQQFALAQGMDAIQKSAAAKGGLLSTNAEQAAVKFAQDNAASYQNQAFNQWLSQNQQQIGMNQSLAGIGQSGANQVGDVGANAALFAGGAQAGANVANANLLGGAVIKAAGNDQLMNSLSKLLGGSTGSTPSPTPNIVTGGLDINTDMNGGSLYSDERLKDDVRRVGYTDDGLPIFTYRMKGGGPKQMGVMAQHMEQVKPEAVSRGAGGFRMVDYDKVS